MKKPEQQPREIQNGLQEAAEQQMSEQLSFPFQKNSPDKCPAFRILAHFYDIFKAFLVVHRKFEKII